MRRPTLRTDDILRWADEFHEWLGRWPHRDDGKVAGAVELTWRQIDAVLKNGSRGLPRGSSLAKLFLANRERRHKGLPPRLTETQILSWADVHHRHSGIRATLVLLVSDGYCYQDAARAVGRKSGDAVAHLVTRFNHEGLAAVTPRHGGGRAPTELPPLRVLLVLDNLAGRPTSCCGCSPTG